ncbi:Fes1-domain-containing protein [Durotheca rogersii]|uniref:Fes1-domain-containing protein n=1 Tax=Durotheca rogersii TaxID=419775 RepID=UPI00221E9B20|nr:Fes1-domain-containing protein [Durotheca rogersii]KAI5862760.1 Fes1-domain-containing protein [Durotheca rogersii]
MDKNLNELLRWGIEHSTPSDSAAAPQHNSSLNAAALASIMGAPSDAELMRASMVAITSADADVSLEARLIAFDNLEQLVESLDNANLLATLGLWSPLLALLAHAEPDLRRMAAWCVGTAVQNNSPCQERLVALGGVERLVRMSLGERLPAEEPAADTAGGANGDTKDEGGQREEEEAKDVRRKAVYALSSAVRNYQPALDVAARELRKRGEHVQDGIDAADMDAVDELINGLKQRAVAA